MKKPNKPNRICGDCIHIAACSAWNVGNLENTNAENCINYQSRLHPDTEPPAAQGITSSMEEAARNGWVYL